MEEITRKSFDIADTDTKLGILFDISHNTRVEVQSINKQVSKNFVFNKIYVGICGFIGGLSAMCLHWLKII